MKIFVTGSTGFIGRHFVESLISIAKSDWDIMLLQRNPDPQLHQGVRSIKGNINDPEAYKEELLNADYVFHIAANADVTSSKSDVWNDHASLEKILNCLKGNSRLKRFVFLSTIGAFDRHSSSNLSHEINNADLPNPKSEYGKVKLASEKLIQNTGLPFTIFRPSWVWGRGMRASSHLAFLNRVIEKKSPLGRLGFPGRASFVYVNDLTNGMARIIEDNGSYLGKSYFVATEKACISDAMLSLQKINKVSSWCIPLAVFRLLRPLHGFLPLAFNFLFLDYLVCNESEFVNDFKITKPVRLMENLNQVAHRDQYAVITGANGGIGLELSKLLSSKYHLLLIDKDLSNLNVSEFEQSKKIQMDLSKKDELVSGLESLLLPRKVSLLVNNAGVGFKDDFEMANVQKEVLLVSVNITAPIILSHYFKKQLAETNGILMNVASSVAFFPLPHMSTYAASKSFVLSWSQAIEEELRNKIKVITFSPSGTRTGFQASAGVKQTNDLLSPEDMASSMYDLILKDCSNARLIGSKSKVLILIMKFLPRKAGLKFLSNLFAGNR
jgi:uncharacterized protein